MSRIARYSVYDIHTDEVICASLSAEECSKILDITIDGFYKHYHMYSRGGNRKTPRYNSKRTTYYIVKEPYFPTKEEVHDICVNNNFNCDICMFQLKNGKCDAQNQIKKALEEFKRFE